MTHIRSYLFHRFSLFSVAPFYGIHNLLDRNTMPGLEIDTFVNSSARTAIASNLLLQQEPVLEAWSFNTSIQALCRWESSECLDLPSPGFQTLPSFQVDRFSCAPRHVEFILDGSPKGDHNLVGGRTEYQSTELVKVADGVIALHAEHIAILARGAVNEHDLAGFFVEFEGNLDLGDELAIDHDMAFFAHGSWVKTTAAIGSEVDVYHVTAVTISNE